MMLLLPLALVGCNRTEDPESFEVDDSFEEGVDLLEDGVPLDFAAKHVVSVLQRDPSPFSNAQAPVTVTSFLKVRWERSGTDVSWEETLCGMEGNQVFGTTTVYPEALIASIGTQSRSGILTTEATGAVLTAGPFVDVLGAELADPEDDLPEEADDPRVLDEDEDGEPGITVHVEQNLLGEGDVYLAQRLTWSMEGTAVAPDRIEGHVTAIREQAILGATEGWLEIEVEEEPDPDPTHSFFIFQAVSSSTTCGSVLSDRDELF